MDGALRTLRWLTLGGWLGSWALFAFVIAPTGTVENSQILPGVVLESRLAARSMPTKIVGPFRLLILTQSLQVPLSPPVSPPAVIPFFFLQASS